MPSTSPRLVSGYGLVEAPFERTTSVFGTYRRADQATASVIGTTSDPSQAIEFLAIRTVPATRLVFVDRGAWTVVLTNHRNGSDFNDHQYWAARLLGVRTIRVVDKAARWWARAGARERVDYEARIFHLEAADGSVVRSIACLDDGGRWVFETSGQPLPVEAGFDGNARRKSARFTSQNLADTLGAVGAAPFSVDEFATTPHFALIVERLANKAWQDRVQGAATSLEEADNPAHGYYMRGLKWVDHMATHYASVIHDFERAVTIDPAYEERVRGYLAEARRLQSNHSHDSAVR